MEGGEATEKQKKGVEYTALRRQLYNRVVRETFGPARGGREEGRGKIIPSSSITHKIGESSSHSGKEEKTPYLRREKLNILLGKNYLLHLC